MSLNRKEGKTMKKSLVSIIEKIERLDPLTDAEKMEYIQYSITEHEGKLAGIPSISTSCMGNPYCKARSENPDLICYYCYAMTYCDYRKSLKNKLYLNTLFYCNYDIPEKAVPLINALYFRFESFGDLINTRQFKNYCTIAKVNGFHAALWTKNCFIIAKAIHEGVKIPDNLKIINSLSRINQTLTKDVYRQRKNKYPFINALFAVYDPGYIQENKVNINCGGKSCRECGYKCYLKNNRTTLIREKLK